MAQPGAEPSGEPAPSVLVVDDVAANRELLERGLVRKRYRVTLAADGLAALAQVEAQEFDLVLLDIMMPGLDGIEVLTRLRERYAPAELPVIMVTAKDSDEDIVTALKRGANDYLTKPVNLKVAYARIQGQLALRRAHQQIAGLARQLEARNRFIRGAFGRYLTDEVVASLLETEGGLSLGGETRAATILMSDLRGFSSLSERLAPKQVIRLLNAYLGAMTEVIHRHGGTIDEFIGDAILVVFGAPSAHPDDALRAVTCAVAMQRAMEGVNAWTSAEGLPHLEMGIGVHTGEVVVGNIGSELRAKYGVVGRHVNLASRIEAYTVGEQVLISESTLRAAGESVRVEASVEVFPKGSAGPMRLHSVSGVGELALPRPADELQRLAAPQPLLLRVLDGVEVPERGTPGLMTHLGGRVAAIETEVRPPALAALALEREGEGLSYAKVLSLREGALVVRFTSLAPGLEALIARLRETGR